MKVFRATWLSGTCSITVTRNLRLSLYLVAACLVILVIFANIVFFERSAQRLLLPSACDPNHIVFGISVPVVDSKFLSLGGTKHWFHLVERLIMNIDRMIELHKTVASIEGRSGRSIYIIFDRKCDVENLGPFGRLLFVSLVSGRKVASEEALFERIIFGHSSLKTTINHSLTKFMEAHYFHPHHTVDVKSRGKTAICSKYFINIIKIMCTCCLLPVHFLLVAAFLDLLNSQKTTSCIFETMYAETSV